MLHETSFSILELLSVFRNSSLERIPRCEVSASKTWIENRNCLGKIILFLLSQRRIKNKEKLCLYHSANIRNLWPITWVWPWALFFNTTWSNFLSSYLSPPTLTHTHIQTTSSSRVQHECCMNSKETSGEFKGQPQGREIAFEKERCFVQTPNLQEEDLGGWEQWEKGWSLYHLWIDWD